ncbi:ATP-binding protein [Pampinifervens florentissimum]|uniref:ATP-binding protein n=1 Tax=Pampinifervens florentissimum TaxID=1632019 RepID=UPI0013B479A6|nr:ATP-binding protein [Hydrogenobacter sp. T-8]QID32305.1 ATP-binding protein [Hydrogenobacter sp. T-8]
MVHAEQVLRDTVNALVRIREQTGSPVHALVWGVWGNGKTFSAHKIRQERHDVFYYKAPAEEVSASKLVKGISLVLGAGSRQSKEATLDLLRYTIASRNIRPIVIIDEAQRLLKRPLLMNELKDLSEDPDFALCYIFLGDQSLPRVVQSTPHSLHKRVVIRRELEQITKETIQTVLKEKKVSGDVDEFFTLAKERGWTTLDAYFTATALAKAGLEATKDNILKVAKGLGR